eukprot:CAMPEP_0194756044 /NCGR_PEP_ID=MMETSP0323_2-20130528/9812_1 /TAXON_ID=2866 ORGANISM="Crypthecodinium cohnii, Strain Seligo" /NCGR_SAMPLE_ID=MMETSP0323_2 /ASSEMBLY_ACC=CAM_ASM_000346 /LENGTH=210 /DNA_ID=CAMNT_0039675377 /DNA_START=456 /DNA_END=1087 /DNA_ORIENTATION=-
MCRTKFGSRIDQPSDCIEGGRKFDELEADEKNDCLRTVPFLKVCITPDRDREHPTFVTPRQSLGASLTIKGNHDSCLLLFVQASQETFSCTNLFDETFLAVLAPVHVYDFGAWMKFVPWQVRRNYFGSASSPGPLFALRLAFAPLELRAWPGTGGAYSASPPTAASKVASASASVVVAVRRAAARASGHARCPTVAGIAAAAFASVLAAL